MAAQARIVRRREQVTSLGIGVPVTILAAFLLRVLRILPVVPGVLLLAAGMAFLVFGNTQRAAFRTWLRDKLTKPAWVARQARILLWTMVPQRMPYNIWFIGKPAGKVWR